MGIGLWQIVAIIVVVLILFGAGKLPKVMGDMGKGMRNFKDGLKGEGEDEKSEITLEKKTSENSDKPSEKTE